MAEPAIELSSDIEPQVETTSRLKSFTVNHPRTAKIVGIAVVTAVTLGAVSAWKARKQDAETTETDAEDVPFDTSSKAA